MSLSFLRPAPIFLLSAGFLLTACALRGDDDLAANPAVVAKAESDRKVARAALERVKLEIGGRAPAELEREILRDAATVYDYLNYLGNPRIPELEKALWSDARVAVNYAERVLKSPWPEAESTIALDPYAAASYAARVLSRPWPEAEPVIFADGPATAWYLEKFPHRATPESRKRMESESALAANRANGEGFFIPGLASGIAEIESAFAYDGKYRLWLKTKKESPQDAARALARILVEAPEPDPEYFYAALLTDPEARAILAKRPGLRTRVFVSTLYSLPESWEMPDDMRDEINAEAMSAVILAKRTGKPAPKATEAIIARHGVAAADYAQEILNRPWPEAEPAILRHPEAAVRYALNVLKKPWPEAEPLIALTPEGAILYAGMLRRARWPEAEAVMAQLADYRLVDYCSKVANCRVPIAEKALLEKGNPSLLANYSSRVIQGRWPEAEAKLILDANAASYYAAEVLRRRWPEAEPVIKRDVGAASRYATGVLKSRWPEMESEILGDPSAGYGYAEALLRERNAVWEATLLKSGEPRYALSYAKNSIGGPWPEAEALIAGDVHSAFEYAKFTGRRFPAVEAEHLKDARSSIRYAELVLKSRWPEAEPLIIRSGLSVEYATKVVKGRWSEAEPEIAKDAKASLAYAKTILRDRFPAGEPAIAKDAESAVVYAKTILCGRFEAAEPAIATNARFAVVYAREFLSGRFLAAEPAIARNADAAADYAHTVIKGRWPEGEAAIAGNGSRAAYYAARILKRRWPEAEPLILAERDHHAVSAYVNAFPEVVDRVVKPTPESAYYHAMKKGIRDAKAEAAILESPYHTLEYAKNLIKGRWPEAEVVLLKNPKDAMTYAREIIKGRWPEAEVEFAKSPHLAALYAARVIKGAWPEAEAVIASHPETALYYARCALKHRWPAGEPAIRRDARMSLIYASEVLNARWPEGEEAILNHAEAATWYSILVLGDRWPEFEKRMDETGWNVEYVIRVVRKRMRDKEPAMIGGAWGYTYINAFVREPDEGLEKILLDQNPTTPGAKRCGDSVVAAYIRCSGRKSWPEYEKFIEGKDYMTVMNFVKRLPGPRRPYYEAHLRNALLTDGARLHADGSSSGNYSYLPSYARSLDAGERLPADLEAALYDQAISSSPYFWPGLYGAKRVHPLFEEKFLKAAAKVRAMKEPRLPGDKYEALLGLGVSYACHIRGSRWPELEEFLFDRPGQALRYRKYHADLRLWPELESALIAAGESRRLKSYRESTDPAKFVARPYFASDDAKLSRDEARVLFENPVRAFGYARDVIRGRWPELEKHLMTKTFADMGFRDEDRWSDAVRETDGMESQERGGAAVAARYIRQIVRGPLPEYEEGFAKETASVLWYSQAIRRDFAAGEPQLFASIRFLYPVNSPVGQYLRQLLDDPESTLDRMRLFKGPDGARFRCEAVRDSISGYVNNTHEECLLREALHARE